MLKQTIKAEAVAGLFFEFALIFIIEFLVVKLGRQGRQGRQARFFFNNNI